MNKSFIILDKTNNVQKIANSIVKFNNEEKDYLIYSIDENEQNKQIFVSRLILNSEGKYFTDNITLEEKNKLSNIVYNIVILTPSNAKKSGNSVELIKELTNKLSINISNEIPDLSEQEYFTNCSIAITGKEFVEEAVKFYTENIKNESELNSTIAVPTWTMPTENSNTITPEATMPIDAQQVQATIPEITPIPQEKPVVTPSVEQINVAPAVETPNIPNSTASTELTENNLNLQSNNTEQVAVVSDPSLRFTNNNMQPNVDNKNAGFAINKYIVIGTICILVAIAVVVVAYILIQKKINGA